MYKKSFTLYVLLDFTVTRKNRYYFTDSLKTFKRNPWSFETQ